MEAEGAEVILVDAGDYSQGKTYVSVTKGADAVTMMNAAGYDVVTLGNHEFDYGYAQLKENMSKAKFKVVCADVFNEAWHPHLRCELHLHHQVRCEGRLLRHGDPRDPDQGQPCAHQGSDLCDR